MTKTAVLEGSTTRERHDPQATREALLASATTLFAERGYHGVPIEELARRAGVNKALISYHFHGKRGLYTAVIEDGFKDIARRFEAAEADHADVRGRLRAVLAVFAAIRREHPDFPALFVREVVSNGISPAAAPHLVTIVGVMRRLVETGRRERTLRSVDPLLLHFALVGSLVFFLATEPARLRFAATHRLPFRMPELSAFLLYLEQVTLRGLAPDPPVRRAKGARA